MSISTYLTSSWAGAPDESYIYVSGSGWKQISEAWVYDANRPHDLDVDPPLEIPTGETGFGVWVYCGYQRAPTQTPSTPSQTYDDTDTGGGAYETRVTVHWTVDNVAPYTSFAVVAEIESCGDGADIFTPAGDWVSWDVGGVNDATAGSWQSDYQTFDWDKVWMRSRIKYTNSFGSGSWSSYSTPTRVTTRFN